MRPPMSLAHAARSMNEAYRALAAGLTPDWPNGGPPGRRRSRRGGDDPWVFISHDHSDKHLIAPIATLLAEHRYEAWWDERIAPGDDFAERIKQAMDRAIATIVLWSPQSVQSPWVKWEAEHVLRHRKLVPIAVPELDLCEVRPPFNVLNTLRAGEHARIIGALGLLRAQR